MADATGRLGDALRTLLAASRRLRGRETHRPGRLSFAQYSLLFRLADEDDLPSVELARSADLAPATVTQMLDGLEAGGLVVRRRSDRDRRVVLVALTDRGREIVAARRAEMEPLWAAALEGFSAAELDTAAAVMARIAAFLDELHETAG